MYLIVHADEAVILTGHIPDGITLDNVAFAESIPDFEPKKGYIGQLMYDGENLYWGYTDINDGISAEEFVSMLEEVL